MKTFARILKKVLEFFGCVACLAIKIYTDIEATRVYYTRQKFSREWSLLNNIFWNRIGDAFAWISYGGYSIITLLLGISICIDSKSKSTYAEKIFLFIGSLMFFGIGALVLASIDQVPEDLIDNAIVLGVLSFIIALLFLLDMSSEKIGKKEKSHTTQTDTSSIDRHNSKGHQIGTVSSEVNLVEHDGNDRKSVQNQSMRSRDSEFINLQPGPINQSQHNFDLKLTPSSSGYNSYHHHHHHQSGHDDSHSQPFEDIVESKTFPTAQMPTFSKIKHYPTVVNHLESEPYKKILSRSTSQSNSYSRYHDQSRMHHENPSFYDDFNKFRQDTYYQGPKVDQVGKLMVIRDYSGHHQQSNQQPCNCQENQNNEKVIKSGYVSQVAKLWDDRTKTDQKEPRSLDTHV